MTIQPVQVAAGLPTPVIMPQLGESVVEGTVSRWLKQPGDAVAAYEPLLEVSTDKVDTEIPAPASGVLLRVLVPAGDTVAAGVLLAEIGSPASAEGGQEHGGLGHSPAPAVSVDAVAGRPHITPVVARMAAEHNLDLSGIVGTGGGGRVTKKDVEAYLASGRQTASISSVIGIVPAAASTGTVDETPPWEQPGTGDLFKSSTPDDAPSSPAAAPAGTPAAPKSTVSPPTVVQSPVSAPVTDSAPAGDVLPLTAMRRAIADHMVRSRHTSPHVTSVFEIDLSAVTAHQRAHEAAFAAQGTRLTLTAYFASAALAGLSAVPVLNGQWTDAGIRLHRRVHLGIAVALADGLIVPVIRDAGDLNLGGLARAITDRATRARSNALQPGETSGGTFTITNHGVSGSVLALPIINQPQAAIMGVGVAEKRVKVITDAHGADSIAIRPCAYFTLTFDHRIADGAAADAFLATVKRVLEGWT